MQKSEYEKAIRRPNYVRANMRFGLSKHYGKCFLASLDWCRTNNSRLSLVLGIIGAALLPAVIRSVGVPVGRILDAIAPAMAYVTLCIVLFVGPFVASYFLYHKLESQNIAIQTEIESAAVTPADIKELIYCCGRRGHRIMHESQVDDGFVVRVKSIVDFVLREQTRELWQRNCRDDLRSWKEQLTDHFLKDDQCRADVPRSRFGESMAWAQSK